MPASPVKAATQLQLQVLAGNDPKIADLAARLPVGRVHATGRTFVPFIRRDLYDQLVAAAANGNAHPPEPRRTGRQARLGQRQVARRLSLPKDWQEIGLGDLVVANDSREDGWYEAIVVQVDGDMLTLRWRDYPRERRIVRHRLRLALLYPNRSRTEACRRREPQGDHKTRGKASRGQSRRQRPALPKDWDEIDINHLVLAKDDRPWRAWWEAIPVEKAGDVLQAALAQDYRQRPADHAATARLGADLPERRLTAKPGWLGSRTGPSLLPPPPAMT